MALWYSEVKGKNNEVSSRYVCKKWVPISFRSLAKSLLWPGSSQWRIYYHRMWSQLSTTCCNLLKWTNGELLVAVDHNQRLTMASETVDPIDRSPSPPSWAVLPHSINRCSSATAGNLYLATFSRWGNHLAYASTQGIIIDWGRSLYISRDSQQVHYLHLLYYVTRNRYPVFIHCITWLAAGTLSSLNVIRHYTWLVADTLSSLSVFRGSQRVHYLHYLCYVARSRYTTFTHCITWLAEGTLFSLTVLLGTQQIHYLHSLYGVAIRRYTIFTQCIAWLAASTLSSLTVFKNVFLFRSEVEGRGQFCQNSFYEFALDAIFSITVIIKYDYWTVSHTM